MSNSKDINSEIQSRVQQRLIEELSAAEKRYRHLVESLRQVVFRYDERGCLSFINRAWAENLGYSNEISVGRDFIDFVCPVDRPTVARAITARSEQTGEYHQELRLIHHHGTSVWFELALSADPQGGGVGLLYNISKHKAIELELEQARDTALESARLKSEFLANMSHEIRTPMNGVLGMLELMKDTDLDAEQRDFIETAYRSGETLLTLLNGILNLAKIEAGHIDLEEIAFDLKILVQDTVCLVTPQAIGKGIEVISTIDDDLPDQLSGDPTRIQEVLVNLLSNAVKFTEHGRVSVNVATCWIASAGDELCLRFDVSDTGIGIAPEYQPRIFETFTQGDGSITRKYGGTGLGLAISKRLVEAMGGELGVESEVGRGSTFRFTVSVKELSTDEGAQSQRSRQAILPFGDGGRLLVVEDNVLNRKVASTMLSRLGYRVDIVENGAEAIAAVQNGSYELVLMDCQMPIMDGYEATRRIRKMQEEGLSAHVPIVAMTANAMQEDRDRCLQAGMDDHLAKPLQMDTLGRMVSRWLRPQVAED